MVLLSNSENLLPFFICFKPWPHSTPQNTLKKETKSASTQIWTSTLFWLFLISLSPLYLDQMAEAGGVRGALICWRSGSPFLFSPFLFCLSLIRPIIDIGFFSPFLFPKCVISSCVLFSSPYRVSVSVADASGLAYSSRCMSCIWYGDEVAFVLALAV